jgi:hypothetical protein
MRCAFEAARRPNAGLTFYILGSAIQKGRTLLPAPLFHYTLFNLEAQLCRYSIATSQRIICRWEGVTAVVRCRTSIVTSQWWSLVQQILNRKCDGQIFAGIETG